jgi:hypothetical protein
MRPSIWRERSRRRARWLWLAVLVLIAAVLWLFFDIIETAWQ